MIKFFKELKAKETQKRKDKGMVTRATLLDNHGLSDSTEKIGWTLLVVGIVAVAYLGINKFFPDLIESVGTKLKEMFTTWSTPTV